MMFGMGMTLTKEEDMQLAERHCLYGKNAADKKEQTGQENDAQLSDERRVSHYKLLFGGLIGMSLIILQDFLSAETLDLSALVSVIAFAVAVPLLAMGILIDDITKPHPSINLSMDYTLVFFGGLNISKSF